MRLFFYHWISENSGRLKFAKSKKKIALKSDFRLEKTFGRGVAPHCERFQASGLLQQTQITQACAIEKSPSKLGDTEPGEKRRKNGSQKKPILESVTDGGRTDGGRTRAPSDPPRKALYLTDKHHSLTLRWEGKLNL